MIRLVRILDILTRVFAAAAFILGVAFWFGYARSLTRMHIGLGTALIICLWMLAGIVLKKGGRTGLVALAVVWGLAIWPFGLLHAAILPGPWHWAIAVVHVAVGALTIVIARQLANASGTERRAP
jgi:hypothetical protein